MPTPIRVTAAHIGEGNIIIKYANKTAYTPPIRVSCKQAYVRPTLNVSYLTYNGTAQELVTGTDTSNVTSYSLGYKKDSEASSDGQITWTSANPTGGKLTATNAGTYHIYYRYTANTDYCGDSSAYVHVGTVNIYKATVEPQITVNSGTLTYNESLIYFVTSDTKW